MKSIGVIRKLDNVGRIVLPKSLRDDMNLTRGTPLDFVVDGNSIRLRKHVKPGTDKGGV